MIEKRDWAKPTCFFTPTSIATDQLLRIRQPVRSFSIQGNFSGKVVGGAITNNGYNTFDVNATLRLSKGGKGDMLVSGVLDHTEFPPTFDGKLSQP